MQLTATYNRTLDPHLDHRGGYLRMRTCRRCRQTFRYNWVIVALRRHGELFMDGRLVVHELWWDDRGRARCSTTDPLL